MSLLQLHFADRMAAIEAKLARSRDATEALRGIDDDFHAYLLSKDYPGYDAVKAALPDYPDVSWVQDCTGNQNLFDAVKEATLFWRLAKEAYAQHGRGKPLSKITAVDYGAGWGRITRFCGKDVGRIVAVEPNPTFHAIYRETRVPAELVASDFESRRRLPVKGADLLFCFSILTHSSDELTRNIAARWAEILAPGGVVLATIRPGTYLDMDNGEIDRLSAEDRAAAKAAYYAGELAYWPYPDCEGWGITITPMAYLERVFSKDFRIIGPRYFLQNQTQLPIVMVRR